jgi:hypothetical protein
MFAYTVIETPVYSGKVTRILTEDERGAFAVFIAQNPTAGSVVRGSGGYEKYAGLEKEVGRAVVLESYIATAWTMVRSGY